MDNKYYYDPEDEKLYYELKKMREKSLSGTPVKRTGTKKEIENKEKRRRTSKIACLAVACMITVGSITPSVARTLQDNAIIDPIINDYQTEVLSEATHRTADNTSYYFDTEYLANNLNNSDDFRRDSYCLLFNMEAHGLDDQVVRDNMNEIYKNTEYGSFDNYLKQIGYENGLADKKDYLKNEKKGIIKIEKRRDEQQEKIDELQKMFPEDVQEIEGEKSL